MSDFTPDRIMQFVWGFAPPIILEAAIRHRVFDTLDASGPMTVSDLASATGTSERGLQAVAGALVSLDLLHKQDDGRYALSPESAAFLVSTKPGFQGAILRHVSRQLVPNWLELTEVVRTGRPVDPVNREESAEFFRDFVEDIFAMSWPAAQALAAALGVGKSTQPVRVLDLAAGSGVWSIALAEASPLVNVTAVDWPMVIPVTQRVTKRRGLTDRYRFVEGDIATVDFGGGYHIATLGHILHSEGEARSRALLGKVFGAVAPGGVIAIGEFLPNDDRTGPPQAMLFAVNMLVHTDAGDVFTFGQLSEWLQEAGFTHPHTVEAPGAPTLIVARKPG